MLKIGGYINILIGLAHLIGLLWANTMFEVTGIGQEMKDLSEIHSSLPYLLTILAALFFFVFGYYGLSAENKHKKLPFLKPVIFTITVIYILRGIGGLAVTTGQRTDLILEILYSLVALIIGLLYLFGGLKIRKSAN
ncbi:hypothetical protein ACFLSE_05800 [Bacteroidota bacterium]